MSDQTPEFSDAERDLAARFVKASYGPSGASAHFPGRSPDDPRIAEVERGLKERGFRTEIEAHRLGGAVVRAYTVPKPMTGLCEGPVPMLSSYHRLLGGASVQAVVPSMAPEVRRRYEELYEEYAKTLAGGGGIAAPE